MPRLSTFEPDEYTAINERYFADLRRDGFAETDPSGWIETLSEAGNLIPIVARHLSPSRYYMDEGESLGTVRHEITQLLEAWDAVPLAREQFTACPSVGMASILTMAVLKRRGVRRVVFETPCYFAAVLQAEWLGLKVEMKPTYAQNGYALPEIARRSDSPAPIAWWITQPRASLGFDQPIGGLRQLAASLRSCDFLVIDEATDQSFPSRLGRWHRTEAGARVIRLKGFTKPLGLNGYRLAFILHDARLRRDLVDCLETFGGSLDHHSLELACTLASAPSQLAKMLRASSEQAAALRVAADKISTGSRVRINPLVNGYIGSAVVDLSALGRNRTTQRHRFLTGCQRKRMPVIIGCSMHFASDPPHEPVRLNFFSRREHILRGVAQLAEIAEGAT